MHLLYLRMQKATPGPQCRGRCRRTDPFFEGLPAPRSSHACVIVNEDANAGTADLLTFGGRVRRLHGSGETVTNELWRLRLTDQSVTGEGELVVGTWVRVHSSTTEQPVPRFDHTAVVHNGAVLVYGGCEGGASAYDDVWQLDYAADQVRRAGGPSAPHAPVLLPLVRSLPCRVYLPP